MLTKCSKGFLVSNMKKIVFNGHIYGLSVDYDAINVDDFRYYKYLMRKNDSIRCLGLLKSVFLQPWCFLTVIRKYTKVHFNEQSRMYSKTRNC